MPKTRVFEGFNGLPAVLTFSMPSKSYENLFFTTYHLLSLLLDPSKGISLKPNPLHSRANLLISTPSQILLYSPRATSKKLLHMHPRTLKFCKNKMGFEIQDSKVPWLSHSGNKRYNSIFTYYPKTGRI